MARTRVSCRRAVPRGTAPRTGRVDTEPSMPASTCRQRNLQVSFTILSPNERPNGVAPQRRSRVVAHLPSGLAALLHAADDVARRHAWAGFLEVYSRLLLDTARRTATNNDEAMDHYAFILDQLRENDFRRLRAFGADGRGKFTTWLVVVARRLCVDHHRHTHGRIQARPHGGTDRSIEQITRRNLVDLVAGEIDWERMEDGRRPHPEVEVIREERRTALSSVVGRLEVVDQLLLTLRFEDDMPLAKIGPMVGLGSRWQVHRRLNTILARLREGLEARGITEQ